MSNGSLKYIHTIASLTFKGLDSSGSSEDRSTPDPLLLGMRVSGCVCSQALVPTVAPSAVEPVVVPSAALLDADEAEAAAEEDAKGAEASKLPVRFFTPKPPKKSLDWSI